MPILPNASVKTKVDFTRSRFEWKRQFEMDPTVNILEEGTILQRVKNAAGTGEVVLPATSTAGELPVGISLQSRISATTFTEVEDIVVPAAPGPYTVQLKHTNLIDTGGGVAEASAWDFDIPAWITVVAAPAAGDVAIDPLTGIATFDVANAEHNVRLTYRFVLTAIERDAILRQSHVNRGAEDQFGLMTVAYGSCVVFTTMYDAFAQWADPTAGPPLQATLGDGGLFTLAGTGEPFGRVISAPTPGDPYLGIEYVTLA